MTLLVDTSVVLKWFHEEGESEVAPARALLAAHRSGRTRALVLDLVLYELGNVLLRPLGQTAVFTRQRLETLLRLCAPVHLRPSWMVVATELAEEHRLSYYDACWAAAAQGFGCPLVTADRALLRAGLGTSPTAAAAALAPGP